MMLHLRPHPANPNDAVGDILAIPDRRRGGLTLGFCLLGKSDAVRWPRLVKQRFADGLWRHSCFEAFVAVADDPGYIELNIAPSKRWAAYRFNDYRQGMHRAKAAPSRLISWCGPNAALTAHFDLPDLPADRPWHIGLSAVIEMLDGTRNYFALAHAPGPPDFHNRDCFTARLPAPEAP